MFDYKDKIYVITAVPEKNNDFNSSINQCGVFGEQIQLQFNSLVKKELNAKIQERKAEVSTSSSSTTSNIASGSQSSIQSQPKQPEETFNNAIFSVKYRTGATLAFVKDGVDISCVDCDLYTIASKVNGKTTEKTKMVWAANGDNEPEFGQKYKISGKSKNLEFIEVTKVEKVDSSNVKTANSGVDIQPKDSAKFAKYVSNYEDGCNTQEGIVTYYNSQYNNSTDGSFAMNINNSNLPTTQEHKNAKESLDRFLNGGSDADDLHLYFISQCMAGYTSVAVGNAESISYPKTDIAKFVYTTNGQSLLSIPTANIYAKKGSNYINISVSVFTYEKVEKNLKDKCGFVLRNFEFPEACWKDLINSSEYKNATKAKAEELVKTFVL